LWLLKRSAFVSVSRDVAPQIESVRAAETMTLNTDFHQAPAARSIDEAQRAPPFRFAPTFIIDFITSACYLPLFALSWARAPHTIMICAIAGLLGLAVAFCYFGKVFIIGFLNQRGGDARTYVISSDLVTTGLYAYSRNPTYLMTLVQYILWTALLVFLQAFAPIHPVVFALSLLLPVAFFVVMDRVIDREDAALGARHPEAFAAYANDVRRWFGRKRAARLES
jgi:protein-S-isoprenylcysteine O-methyltransferase Ste14